MGSTGFELPPANTGKTGISDQSGVECGALDRELAAVVDAWPVLPEAIKAGILAMVPAADPPLGRILSGVKTGEKPSHPEKSRSEQK